MICWKQHEPSAVCPFCALEQAEANLIALAKVHRDGTMEQTVLRAENQRLRDAAAKPDCRVCTFIERCLSLDKDDCINGDKFEEWAKTQLWRTKP